MSDFTDAVDREAAWFKADLSAQAIPPLLIAGNNGAPFNVVRARVAKPPTRGTALYIWLENVEERRYALTRKLQVYSLVASCVWMRNKTPGQSADDDQNLEGAVAKVLKRIRGPQGDKTHGGRFLASGEIESGRITAHFPDPVWTPLSTTLWQAQAKRADVRWQAIDELVA